MRWIKSLVINISKYLAGIIPKKHNLWLFGAWEGKNYSDNSKYMFEYIINNHPEIKAVWLTKSEDVVLLLKEKGYTCYKKWSIKGIWSAFRAEAAFETQGDGDVSSFMNGTIIIQLWHGIGAKAMKWKRDEGFTLNKRLLQKRKENTFWMGTSEMYVEVFSELLKINKDKFFITGYPRNDTLITQPYNEYMNKFKEMHNSSKMVIYVPTHRNFGKSGNNFINLESLRKVDRFLRKNDIYMFYKPHIHELENFLHVENEFTNIIFAREQSVFADIYSYLHYFDLLISDYSSIMTDFACLGRPIITFPYDIDDYKTNDGGLCDYYYDYKLGPFCYSWEEVMEEIIHLLEEDTWKERRECALRHYHEYNDGNNCRRVCLAVKEILKTK